MFLLLRSNSTSSGLFTDGRRYGKLEFEKLRERHTSSFHTQRSKDAAARSFPVTRDCISNLEIKRQILHAKFLRIYFFFFFLYRASQIIIVLSFIFKIY